ncbi:class I SAM-dependent methyltransferase [Jatrophihabitans sp. YIM 134969]
MPDAVFDDPRLAAAYDPLDPDRSDLDAYVAMAEEFDAHDVVDVGCGTGTFALRLAGLGHDVVGVDPAAASLDIARAKPGADRVRWIHGVAADLPSLQTDLMTMTANVAQAIVTDADWSATLAAARRVVRPGGRLVFETRDPAAQGWRDWTPDRSRVSADLPGRGVVESVHELLEVALPLVTFTDTIRFLATGEVLTSRSTLRFRDREEVTRDLRAAGFVVDEVRDAPDRPGREFVFVARRDQAPPGTTNPDS